MCPVSSVGASWARDISDDEVASANKRINDIHTGIGKRAVKFGLEDMLDAFHHEIDNRLWCVDDAVRVCDLDRETLKKLLVDGVEESLFLREVGDGCGGLFNRNVERV